MLAVVYAHRLGLFRREYWFRNLFAGVVVGVLAAPLAIAFSIASGAQPEQGLYTAIITSLSVALLGGTRVQIAGPTSALVMMLSQVTLHYGLEALQVVTILSGLILLAMGFFKFGSIVKRIPTTVVHGFSFGIGISIFINQFKEFFGIAVTLSPGITFFQKISLLLHGLTSFSVNTTLLSLFGVMLIVVCGRISQKIPAPIVTLATVTLLNSWFQFDDVATIESAYGSIPQHLPVFQVPMVSGSVLIHLIIPACSIALLSTIETLLSASATDKYTGDQHKPNQELIGLGLGNIISPFFGGFAATGTLTRTMTSLRYGANSPLAAVCHAGVLIAVLFILAPIANAIPLCGLAAVLYVVAFNMTNLSFLRAYLLRVSLLERFVFFVTFSLTLIYDLSTAILVGAFLFHSVPLVFELIQRFRERYFLI